MTRPKYIAATYKPAEMEAATNALVQQSFTPEQASAIVIALHKRGFRIIKTGEQS